jgi:hypothetical protein
MTPKEKAQELLDKMAFEVCKTDAKQCALIAVDLILTEHPMANDYFYWLDVKTEIEAL